MTDMSSAAAPQRVASWTLSGAALDPRRVIRRLAPLVVPTALFVLWQIASTRHWMSPQVLPTPALVWETARELAADNLFAQLLVSLKRLATGFAIASVLGGALGLGMGLSRRFESFFYPTFIALVQIPTLAWIPLLMTLLGLGEALKIVIIVKAVLTPVAIHAFTGVRNIDPRLVEAARALRLPARQRFLQLILPAALGPFTTGLRLGLAQAWTALLAVEMLASSEGIGFLMVWGRQLFQLDIVFVCIAVIGAVGFAMDRFARGVEGAIVRWPQSAIGADVTLARESRKPVALVLPIALAAAWFGVSRLGSADPNLLPAPETVAAAFAQGISDNSLVSGVLVTLARAAAGLAIGGGLGLLVGLALGLAPAAARLFDGTLTCLRLIAVFAWLPLISAWFGLGEAAKIAFVSMACFFPLQVATQRGVETLSPQLVETARALRLAPAARLRLLVLPGAAPSIFAGLRIGLVVAWIAAMGSEYFLPAGGGIGGLMINAEQLFRTEVVVSGMVIVAIVAALISMLGLRIERFATRWRRQ